jgi:hypothetical protein
VADPGVPANRRPPLIVNLPKPLERHGVQADGNALLQTDPATNNALTVGHRTRLVDWA